MTATFSHRDVKRFQRQRFTPQAWGTPPGDQSGMAERLNSLRTAFLITGDAVNTLKGAPQYEIIKGK